MGLWDAARVEEVERTNEFQTWLVGSKKRSAAARAVADRRRDELFEELLNWAPTVRIPPVDLVALACRHYEQHHASHGRYRVAGTHDPDFVRRIVGNFVRHECTDYEAKLSEIRGRVGVGDAYHEVRSTVMRAVDKGIEEALEHLQTTRIAS